MLLKAIRASLKLSVDSKDIVVWNFVDLEATEPDKVFIATGFIFTRAEKKYVSFIACPSYNQKDIIKDILINLQKKTKEDLWLEVKEDDIPALHASVDAGFLGVDRGAGKIIMLRMRGIL